jgi:broad specificity phosphatase PhoE
MTCSTFYLCRHGQTEYNRAHRVQGQIDTPLTSQGVADALRVAERLRGLRFARVLASDLGRAFRTAYIITQSLGIREPIEASPALRERHFGDYAGIASAEIRSRFPLVFGDSNYAPPGGESHRAVQERVLALLFSVAEQQPVGDVLVVTHDGVLNAVSAAGAGVDVAEYHARHHNAHDVVLRAEVAGGALISVQSLPREALAAGEPY